VVRYLHYRFKHHHSRVPIPEFAIPPELALEVLMAANYLDC
jgi:elongin-C